ncbi:MAG: MFS transporter [Aggregatilineales bacterium]
MTDTIRDTVTTRAHNLRTFYALILTQTFSMMGSRISGLAIGIWLFTETGNATPLLLVSFFAVVPQVVASSLAGVMSDRWDRRYVMVLADAGQAVGTVLLLISFATDGFQLWHLYSVTFIQAIFSVFQGPAFTASMTMLIPDDQRDRANAIQQLTGPMAGVFAPAIAGVVYATVGITGAIVVDLLTFFVAMAVVFSMHIPRPDQTDEGKAEQGSVWFEMWTGLRWMRQYPAMLAMMGYIALLNFLVVSSIGLDIPYILARTDNNEILVGVLNSVVNIGAIAGGITFGIWGGTRPRIYTILGGVIVGSVFLTIHGMAQTPVVLGLTLFLFMFPMPMVNASAMSLMQAKVPPDMQGRVFAFMGQVSMLLTPFAYLAAGPLADKGFEPAVGAAGWDVVAPLVGNSAGSGMGLMMVIGGVACGAISVFMLSLPAIRNLEANMPDYVAVKGPAVTESEAPEVDDMLMPDAVPVS